MSLHVKRALPASLAVYALFAIVASLIALAADWRVALAIAALAGAVGLGGWAMGAFRAPDEGGDPIERAFSLIYDNHGAVCAALSDLDGRLLRMNRQAVDAAGDRCVSAAALFDSLTEGGDAIAYRLIRRMRSDAYAIERHKVAGMTHFFYARPMGARHIIWWTGQIDPAQAVEGVNSPAATETLLEALPVPVARLSHEGDILFMNAAARQLLGDDARLGVNIGALIEGMGARSIGVRLEEASKGDSQGRMEVARVKRAGPEAFLQVGLTQLTIGAGSSLVAVLADATELKTLEAQFVQSQKMQAVGQLAGGVAHDFNNLLTAISGHADLLLLRRSNEDPDYADLTQIRQNVNRAAGLVRQLLAFSRKQTLRPSKVDLDDSMTEISHLLNRLLGEKVVLRIENGAGDHMVKVDERQFEQVIMNLVVNARDAMPGGGVVTLRTGHEIVETDRRVGQALVPRGEYVRIDVVDQGSGIPADKLDKVFEPFFTTKRQGEGTGLGLSTVYGIVKQTGGFIFVDSAPGRGSTFTIFLPRHVPGAAGETPARKPQIAERDLTGSGAVLLIEDEAPVRAFAARALKLRGYEVSEAASAEEALELLSDESFRIDVIVSDVVMPGMDGPSCVREARNARPDVAVVFMSGYAEDALKRGMDDLENTKFLAKPFSLNELTLTVKEALES